MWSGIILACLFWVRSNLYARVIDVHILTEALHPLAVPIPDLDSRTHAPSPVTAFLANAVFIFNVI